MAQRPSVRWNERNEWWMAWVCRRAALGIAAAAEQPDHLIELLGPVPEDDRTRAGWSQYASRVDAYREKWNIEPDQLHDSPRDAVQYREWDTAVHTIELINRLDSPHIDHGLERGFGMEL